MLFYNLIFIKSQSIFYSNKKKNDFSKSTLHICSSFKVFCIIVFSYIGEQQPIFLS